MKISYRTHPILEKLANRSLGRLPVLESDKKFFEEKMGYFVGSWKKYADKFSRKVIKVSSPVVEAFNIAKPKMKSLWFDMADNKLGYEAAETIIYNEQCHMIYFNVRKEDDGIEFVHFSFTIEGIPMLCHWTSGDEKRVSEGWLSPEFFGGDEPVTQQDLLSFTSEILTLSLFLKYAEIETKYLAPGQKDKGIICKYKNDTKLGITFVDSTWFTNLVKSDGFKVRGHFRLQPKKKDGEWTKELIWINDFQKSGYTAQARMLNA